MTEQLLKVGATIGGFSPPIVVGGLIRATFGQWRWYTQEMFVNRILQVLQYDAPAVTAANIDLVSVADPSVTFRIIGVPGATCAVTGFCPPPPPQMGYGPKRGFGRQCLAGTKRLEGRCRDALEGKGSQPRSSHCCLFQPAVFVHAGKPTGVVVSHCITRFQTQPILATCQIRHHSHCGIIVALHSSEP